MTRPVSLAALLAASACATVLAGCAAPETAGQAHRMTLAEDSAPPPPDAPADACYAHDSTPAVIETVTEQVIDSPAVTAPDGTVLKPATFRTETHQQIATPAQQLVLQTPCRAEMTPDLIRALQRALAARGLYHGPVTGQMTPDTRAALRRYQQPRGLNSAILTKQTAKSLGLIAWGYKHG